MYSQGNTPAVGLPPVGDPAGAGLAQLRKEALAVVADGALLGGGHGQRPEQLHVIVAHVGQVDVRRARRIEVGVYLFTAVALIVLGIFLTSKILNWIVGPAFVVAMVTMVTPLVLRIMGVRDPDEGYAERATPGTERAG